LCCSEVLEHAEVGLATQQALQFLGNLDTTAYYYHVDIVAGAFQEDVADVSAYYVALHAKMIGSLADEVENGLVKYLGKFFVGI
jgi:hypothetical protein